MLVACRWNPCSVTILCWWHSQLSRNSEILDLIELLEYHGIPDLHSYKLHHLVGFMVPDPWLSANSPMSRLGVQASSELWIWGAWHLRTGRFSCGPQSFTDHVGPEWFLFGSSQCSTWGLAAGRPGGVFVRHLQKVRDVWSSSGDRGCKGIKMYQGILKIAITQKQ